MGLRQSTWVSRPAGAASRLVGLHTPPSTYSRPPMRTGANSHGTVHEASTASPTVARGAPGLPNTTRRPLRAVHGGDAQPSVEARRRALDLGAQPGQGVGRAGEPAQQQRADQRAPRRGHAQRQRREGGAGGEGGLTGAPGGGDRGHRQTAAGGRRRPAGARCPPTTGGAARCRHQVGGHDRARRGAHEGLALAQVESAPSSIPARTPIIQASPSTPPPPRTRTSGRVRTSVAGYPGARRTPGAGCMR